MKNTATDLKTRARLLRARRGRRGVAMLVVMFILLMITAVAAFAVRSTSFEIRSAGHARRAMQTRHLASGGLMAGIALSDQLGPNVMCMAVSQQQYVTTASRAGGSAGLRLAVEETSFGRQQDFLTMTMGDFVGHAGIEGQPVETASGSESLGPGMGYQPDFWVDVYDVREVTQPVAGHDAGGTGVVHFMEGVYTARARTRPPSVLGLAAAYSQAGSVPTTSAEARYQDRSYHETAMNARAVARVGPFAGCAQ